MNALFTAIYNKYSSDPLANSLTGLFSTEAPAGIVFPYGVFSLISDVPDWTLDTDEKFEDCLVQFSLFSDHQTSPAEIGNLFELLKTMLDFGNLTISGYTVISLVRESAILVRVDNVWQYTITYRILLKKN